MDETAALKGRNTITWVYKKLSWYERSRIDLDADTNSYYKRLGTAVNDRMDW